VQTESSRRWLTLKAASVTSVAARGLDVKDLVLASTTTPNHLEEYVHRAGRTGRNGTRHGCDVHLEEEQAYA
jgi:ATP-dependent RNA helicase DDX46/PRP5